MKVLNAVPRAVPGLFAFVLLSCASSSEHSPQTTSSRAGPTGTREDPFQVTIVHFEPDGSQRIERETITLEEQKAYARQIADAPSRALITQGSGGEVTGSVSQALLSTTSCSSADLLMWDAANYTGNQICWIGVGTSAALSGYTRWCAGLYCVGWDSAVQSWQGGGIYNSYYRKGWFCAYPSQSVRNYEHWAWGYGQPQAQSYAANSLTLRIADYNSW